MTILPPPYALAIAGYDPCGGAGLLADAKTFEAFGVLGLTAMTANTIQSGSAYESTIWVDEDTLLRQIELLYESYLPAAIKVGMMRNHATMSRVLDMVQAHYPGRAVPVVVDPVLRATAAQRGLHGRMSGSLRDWLPRVTLLTPNVPEYEQLFGAASPADVAAEYGVSILLKGGHAPSQGQPGVVDRLFTGGLEHQFEVPRVPFDKHGTGCVLSSAIAAQLAQGVSLIDACRQAQCYVARFLASAPGRLGLHYAPR